MKTRRQQLAARCCGVKPNECRDKSRAASKNARGLTVRADGKRTALYEFTWYDLNSDNVVDSGELKTNTYDWSYDDVGRLTDEALDHWDDTFDQTDSFTFDLTGNRTRLERDHGNDGVDQVITYDFDANDRLLNEILDDLVDNSKDTTTTYAYDHTQQTSKTVTAASQTVSKQVFGYNLQGRMSSVINEGYTSGTLSSRERTSYSYDSKSFRVEATTETGTATGTIANETWTLESSTSFLADAHNHTGYTQTIREVKTNADSTTETRDYTFGHDEIAQRVVTRDDQGQVTNDQTHIFGHDGHGSVRILYDLAVAVAPIVQAMTFTAYGELLALHNTAGAPLATTARLSSLGYSGEHFDSAAQQQYLRARFYSPTTGRFNRLDPFAGNMQDPQSLHKYAYVHGDPIQGIDPSGLARKSGSSVPSGLDPFKGDSFFTKVGRAAHDAIQEDYRRWARQHNQVVQTNSTHPHFLGIIEPDLLNLTESKIGEIKPDSSTGIAKGAVQLRAAIAMANGIDTIYGGWHWYDGSILPGANDQSNTWTGETWSPGIGGFKAYWLGANNASLSKEVVVTLGNWGGLIVYHRVKMTGREQPAVAIERAVEMAREVVKTVRVNNFSLPTPTEQLLIDHMLLQRVAVAGLVATAGATAYVYGPALATGFGTMLSTASLNASMGFA